ncbi:MAG: hypothetical protein LBK42_12650 [Propionibacteriaceae bacterium]|jgi:hypothetical protein|nr:hypothetical protein [Propionibacteriaceae bacterium]
MPGWAKKTLAALVVAFVLFFVVTRPDDAAAAVHSFAATGQSIIQFFRSLVA